MPKHERDNPEKLSLLWAKNPLCHWCGRTTRLIVQNGGKLPKMAATVDHLITKRMGKGHRGRRVLACNGCNLQRAKDENVLTTQKNFTERERVQRLIAESP